MNSITSIRPQSLTAPEHIELQTRETSTWASANVAFTPHSPEALAGLKTKMTDLFRGDRTEENGAEMDELVKGRANKLHEMGFIPADVERLLDKAERMDRVTVPTQGGVAGIPFVVVSIVLDKVPRVTAAAANNPGYIGFISGSLSGASDTLGAGLLSKATEDTLWLMAPADKLEPIMAASQKTKAEANSLKRAIESALSLQTFSARNIAVGSVDAILNATVGPEVATAIGTGLRAAGGFVASALSAVIIHKCLKAAGLVGGAQLFGRIDWEKQVMELNDCSPSRRYINGAKRAGKFPLDVATDTLSSVRNVFEAGNLLTNGAFGGGSALASISRRAAKTAALNQGLPPGGVAAADQAVNFVVSAVALAFYGFFTVQAPKVAAAGVKVIQEDIPPKAQKLADSTQKGIEEGAKATGKFVGATYDSTKISLTGAGTALGNAYTSGTEALGRAALSGANLVGELAGRSGLRRRQGPPDGGADQE